MRKLVMSLICLIFVICSYAQKNNTKDTAKVKNAFATNYPKVQNVKWRIEKQGEYEVEYKKNKIESFILNETAVNLLEIEVKINTD